MDNSEIHANTSDNIGGELSVVVVTLVDAEHLANCLQAMSPHS